MWGIFNALFGSGSTDEADEELSTPSKAELNPVIWDIIIRQHLQRPLPPPTGNNDPSIIRQPELATLMRVSKQFNNLVGPALYRAVITDSLPLFIVNISRSSIRGIPSKAQLLEYTERLHLEYANKDVTYPSLLTDGALYSLVAALPSDLYPICREETIAVTAAAGELCGRLVNLKCVCTGTFLSDQREVWEHMWTERPGDIYQRMAEGVSAVSSMFLSLDHPISCCQRAAYGPLTYVSVLWSPPLSTRPAGLTRGFDHRIHLQGGGELGPVSIAANGTSRWYVRIDPIPGDVSGYKVFEKLYSLIDRMIWIRENSFRQKEPKERAWTLENSALDIDIYLPPCLSTGKNEIRHIKRFAEQRMKESLRNLNVPKSHSGRDTFTFRKIEEAPPCVCGWSTDHL